MLKDVQELDRLADLDPAESSPEAICAEVSAIFEVRPTEVALLELRGSLLSFLFPVELRTAGAIPVSSSAVAARTAQSRKAEVFNSFGSVNHFSVFELVKLGDSGLDAQVIQKLMSAPLFNADDEVVGVIQVSRKGVRPAVSGPDFTQSDLYKLEHVARVVSRLMTRRRHVAW